MTLKIRPGTPADASQINIMRRRAFAGTIWTRAMFPNGVSDASREALVSRIVSDFNDDKIVYMVVEDTTTGAVIASSKWTVQQHERPESEWNVPAPKIDMRGEGNQEAIDLGLWTLHEARLRLLQGRPHMLLDRLETAPEYQGKGAGAMLVQWGTSYAEELGLPCYLESTAAGHKLYERYGFRDVEDLVVDFTPCGLPEQSTTIAMERPTTKGVSSVRR